MENTCKPLISILIPCYNSAIFIDRCIKSIINQTIGIENLQVICINDASTDNTLEYLKKWENRYPEQFIVISYDENLRQGGAMNIGMEYASADYVGFMGSDDWVEPEMYEELYKQAVSQDCDAVKCQMIRDDGNTSIPLADNSYPEIICSQFEIREGFCWSQFPHGHNGLDGGSIGIYRRSIISDNKIRFPEKIVYEDLYWFGLFRLYSPRICIVDRIYYHYYINVYSTIMKQNSLHHLDRLVSMTMLMDEYRARGVFKVFYEEIMKDFIRLFYLNSMYLFFTRFDKTPLIYNEMREAIYDYFPDWEKYYDISNNPNKRLSLLLDFLIKNPTAGEEELENLKQHYFDT